jgi:membrane protease YdiL (CAAX protease family)
VRPALLPGASAGQGHPIERAPDLDAHLAWPALVRPVVLLALLGAVVAARYLALRTDGADPIVNGYAFGLALIVIATIGRVGVRPDRQAAIGRSVAIGLAGGGALIVLALVGRFVANPPVLPPVFAAGVFGPWAVATIVVAFGEEAVVRGLLFNSVARIGGAWPAILVTSLAFALMHVPFYGWRVVPLDLGVGIWLAGLRLASGGILAPSIAHSIADIATWWL